MTQLYITQRRFEKVQISYDSSRIE